MIWFSWLATSTITAADGGDTLSTALRQLYFEGAESERYSRSAEVTAHAVERASDVADHVRAGLRRITLDAIFTVDPTNAREELDSLLRAGQPITIRTEIGEYNDMVLTSVAEPRSSSTGDAYYCTIEAQEIRRVDSEETEAPAPQVERARATTNRGRQQTTETATTSPTSTAATDRATALLARVADAVAGRRVLGGE